MKFMTSTLFFSLLVIGSMADVQEKPQVQDALATDTRTQLKRGADDSRQSNANSSPVASVNPSSTVSNLPQFYGGHFAQLGNFFASGAAPQIYYVKAPQSNHAGVQYASANALKIAYAPQQPQHSVAYAAAPTNSKAAFASQPLYQPYQLTYTHQPFSYSPAVPYNHQQQQQQIIPIANGYQLAAIPHQQVQVSQPYSYVTSAPAEGGNKVVHTPNNAAQTNNAYYHQPPTNNAYHQQPQTFTFPTYQHVAAAPINIPTTQKFGAFQSYSPAQYKTITGPAHPTAPLAATHGANDGATSFATFSQQLNQRHHTTPTAITPVKVLAQPQQYYVTVPPQQPSPAGYSSQKIAFQPITAASSSPQAYESPHNLNGVIHYGSHLYHPALAKYAYGPVVPSSSPQKLIYSH